MVQRDFKMEWLNKTCHRRISMRYIKAKRIQTTVSAMVLTVGFFGPIESLASDVIKHQIKLKSECVVLLHGLARSSASLSKMGNYLKRAGYRVVNRDYSSRKLPIEKLADQTVSHAVQTCDEHKAKKIHFVSHSMGGILIRYYLSQHQLVNLGHIVMLSPPNKGSEVVDKLRNVPGFYAINGPAGMQLGTDKNSLPNQLQPVDYPVGIITGNKSINLILSLLIPGIDDGKVSVENARLDGMTDFLVVEHTHPMIMRSDDVIRQTEFFLKHRQFKR